MLCLLDIFSDSYIYFIIIYGAFKVLTALKVMIQTTISIISGLFGVMRLTGLIVSNPGYYESAGLSTSCSQCLVALFSWKISIDERSQICSYPSKDVSRKGLPRSPPYNINIKIMYVFSVKFTMPWRWNYSFYDLRILHFFLKYNVISENAF